MNIKNFLLFLLLLLFNGCAERGYKLTTNTHIGTSIAQNSTNIDSSVSEKEQQKTLENMQKAVKQALHKDVIKNKNSISIPLNEDEILASSTEDLIFKRENKTYYKFGNSEIHGHLIYLLPTGGETRLKNTKIYLLKATPKLNNWYKNAYLKNKNLSHSVTVQYLNKTYLNLSKNFAFHGIAPNTYYVVIVSDKPHNDNERVYIAKKIKVEKHKKIMAVFSKKLQ